MRVVVAMTGASGAPFGVRALEILGGRADIETHLVMSRSAGMTVTHECPGWSVRDVERLADVVHRPTAIGATIASGSYRVDAMLVLPCSIKTLSAVAYGYAADLIGRAADVMLKEGRPLLLLVRETPLHLGHLRTMTAAAENGAVIMPPVPAFYTLPRTAEDIVDHTVRRALSRAGIPDVAPPEWDGRVDGRRHEPG
ncbi:UbiX family flavin prenyltransferase [Pseudonocardia endophytica]|uniref:Flavin prenyltransferase UbiX n=1 Tax=Pseudonocardia endophytica TaxID=401976 RepID=A0A4R1HWC0_PSEEN|nr:UbiX family flavin prenyltransferase [Pseudonocardia endophytica]TCK21832.1 4-hydroxy-3-polyprenylbenzoate decarboxylase [Pseudonocardia endophytica]